ncbi:hypothetical protein O181_011279 [Austropuccinia psidii MF-1]|uniref:Chromatin modification-related protein EAF6 n=1 Tax=Austropuccinia psidii MF-1 TaxID=1389203 RepID=A0A9Q3GLP9_9BASI|nr:hypothetical protein [Austropuccinia psidii MF-1]
MTEPSVTNVGSSVVETANDETNNLSGTTPNPSENVTRTSQPAEINEELSERLEAAKKDLAMNLAKKKKLDKELNALEATLYAHETAYLTDPSANSFGNIVKGYEAYVKAPPSTTIAGDHPSTRRKRTYTYSNLGSNAPTELVGDAERIFSKSSGSYARALELRNKEHESNVTSEQESVVPTLQQTEPKKKPKS